MGIKAALRPGLRLLVRPIWRPVWRRIEARIDARSAEGGDSEQLLRRHPAAFLDAVSTMAALAHEVRQLRARVEALENRAGAEIVVPAVYEEAPGERRAADGNGRLPV